MHTRTTRTQTNERFAPFYSGSGYGGEAVSYVDALLGAGAARPQDVWVTHAGDGVAPAAVAGMDPGLRALLERQEYAALARGALPAAELARPAVAVCHAFPDCWARRPRAGGSGGGGEGGRGSNGDNGDSGGDDDDDDDDGGAMQAPGCPCPPPAARGAVAYVVGRTMFETAGLPRRLAARCNAMDEVWVPTAFNAATFAAAGVDPAKLRVVEEGACARA